MTKEKMDKAQRLEYIIKELLKFLDIDKHELVHMTNRVNSFKAIIQLDEDLASIILKENIV